MVYTILTQLMCKYDSASSIVFKSVTINFQRGKRKYKKAKVIYAVPEPKSKVTVVLSNFDPSRVMRS